MAMDHVSLFGKVLRHNFCISPSHWKTVFPLPLHAWPANILLTWSTNVQQIEYRLVGYVNISSSLLNISKADVCSTSGRYANVAWYWQIGRTKILWKTSRICSTDIKKILFVFTIDTTTLLPRRSRHFFDYFDAVSPDAGFSSSLLLSSGLEYFSIIRLTASSPLDCHSRRFSSA